LNSLIQQSVDCNNYIIRLFPEVKWAQRKDRLFVTIELADFENQKIDLTPEGTLKFQYVYCISFLFYFYFTILH